VRQEILTKKKSHGVKISSVFNGLDPNYLRIGRIEWASKILGHQGKQVVFQYFVWGRIENKMGNSLILHLPKTKQKYICCA
jgi:hypothetical protein